MATSFDQAFSPDFLSSLGPDNPDQNVMQPQNLLPPQYAYQGQGAALDGAVPPAQQQNVLQQVSADSGQMQPGQTAPLNPAAPQMAPTDPNAAAQGQPANQPQAQPNLGQIAPVQPTTVQPRPRLSLLQTLGKISNAMALAHTGQAQYLTPLQRQQQEQLAQQQVDAGALGNLAKQQDIAQTGVATTQNANQVVGGFARGLQSLQKAGSNLDIAAPVLAQQMGIPSNQAAAIIAQAKADPNFLDAFADAADPQKGGSAGKALALAFTPAMDAQGHQVLLQAGADGTPHPLQGYTPLGQTGVVDNGTTNVIYDKRTGQPLRTMARSGAPESGTVATGTDANGNPTYAPLPNSTRSLTNQHLTIENQGAQDKANAAAAAQRSAYVGATSNLANLKAGIDTLQRLGATPSTSQNAVGNFVNVLQGTAAGQEAAKVLNPQVAQARSQIQQAAQGLMLSMTAGKGQMFRTNAEQQRALRMINDPTTPYPVMLQAYRTLSAMTQSLAPAAGETSAAPARPAAPRPTLTRRSAAAPASNSSGWGKVQVTP